MVFESLITFNKAKKRPWELFFLGIFYTSLAIILGLWIFKDYVSLVIVFLTVMASIHVIFVIISKEEEEDIKETKEIILLKEHSRILLMFIFLF